MYMVWLFINTLVWLIEVAIRYTPKLCHSPEVRTKEVRSSDTLFANQNINSMHGDLYPVVFFQRPVLNCLGYVIALYGIFALEIGDCSGNTERSVVTSG